MTNLTQSIIPRSIVHKTTPTKICSTGIESLGNTRMENTDVVLHNATNNVLQWQ
ncbi:hypothetical protein SIPHO058v2_p0022 [Vibrio phage 14E30.2]|nr:hypothetical protein SIPHO058v2_p0022 [Vibrio phage 14E30.2]